MAIIDNTLAFSDEQAITATALSTNVVDTGLAGTPAGHSAALVKDVGKSRTIPVEVLVIEAFNNLTSLKVSVETDSVAAMSSAQEVASRTYLLAELTAGARLEFPAVIPEGADEQFLALRYTVTGVAPTTGKISAHVVAGRQTNA